jgi:hypothetical protein
MATLEYTESEWKKLKANVFLVWVRRHISPKAKVTLDKQFGIYVLEVACEREAALVCILEDQVRYEGHPLLSFWK